MLIDSIFLILMLMALWKGYRNGLVVGAFSFLGIIIGLAAALKLSAVVAGKLKESTQLTATWLPIVSFLLVMLGVALLIRVGATIVQTTLELAFLGWVNKLCGVVLYACLYITVFSVLLFYAVNMHLIKPETLAASRSYPFVAPWGSKIINGFGAVIPVFKGLFDELTQFFESIGKHIR
ncbi:CvpA family protein [Hydrobacter penzbergensis]|jgi:membrane protein required for colicin V production|nr:CvpA family protein [Hydrobacter penzbergensis]